MKLKLLVIALVVGSIALAFWLGVNWFVWSMADFDCVEGYCPRRAELIVSMTLKVGLPSLAWLAVVMMLAREWKKS